MIVKLLSEHNLEFLSLKGSCRGSSESTLVKMSNCWKSHALAQLIWLHGSNSLKRLRLFYFLQIGLFNVFPIVCGSSVLVFVLLCFTLCPF